jgi:hypothetical protein
VVDEVRILRLLRSISDIVIDRLKALGDLQDFVSQIAEFVTRA